MNLEYKVFVEKEAECLKKVDDKFRDYALSLGAEEVFIPAMIPKKLLDRMGYFSHFPQHLTCVSSLTSNEQNMFLTPAACLHIYPTLENKLIDSKIITTRARVYRYENNCFDGKTRFWDFTVREIVFVGSEGFVKKNLEKTKEYALKYTKELNIDASLKTSTDSFIDDRRHILLKKFQKSNNLKEELVTINNGNETALSSFNFHDTRFSKQFNFDQNHSIVTGCVGFGLERWVSSIIEKINTTEMNDL